MSSEAFLRKISVWRRRHFRQAWRAIVKSGDRKKTASKFGGLPWLLPDESWPRCPLCEDPLTFFLQLDLSKLPRALGSKHGEGLFQIFYCTSTKKDCEAEYEGWRAYSDTHLLRVMPPKGVKQVADQPKGLELYPARTIVGWTVFDDLPDPEEHDDLGLHYAYNFKQGTVAVTCDEPKVALPRIELDEGVDIAEMIASSVEGDKLAGWPRWVQQVEYPTCSKCGKDMGYVFQLDSEDSVPHMFGDSGCGHIFQCPDHLDVLAFQWACC